MARYEDWVPPPPVENISEEEQLFDDLLERAIRTPLTMQSFFDSERPPLTQEEAPFRTLRLIEIGARCDFLSAVLLLGSPALAWGAERHALGTLEALAQAAWILGQLPDAPSDAADRATCVDLARSIAQRDAWRRGGGDDAHVATAEAEVERAASRHAATGCGCGGRDASSVHAALLALTADAEGTLAELPAAWTLLGAAAAGVGAERFIAPPKGDALAFAPYTHRALLLATVLHAYGLTAGWLLAIDHPSHADMMAHLTQKLLEAREMQAALRGELDAT